MLIGWEHGSWLRPSLKQGILYFCQPNPDVVAETAQEIIETSSCEKAIILHHSVNTAMFSQTSCLFSRQNVWEMWVSKDRFEQSDDTI